MDQVKNDPTVESILSDIRVLPEKDFLTLLSKLFGQAAECGMADSTSFAWRHKILDAPHNMSEGVT